MVPMNTLPPLPGTIQEQSEEALLPLAKEFFTILTFDTAQELRADIRHAAGEETKELYSSTERMADMNMRVATQYQHTRTGSVVYEAGPLTYQQKWFLLGLIAWRAGVYVPSRWDRLGNICHELCRSRQRPVAVPDGATPKLIEFGSVIASERYRE